MPAKSALAPFAVAAPINRHCGRLFARLHWALLLPCLVSFALGYSPAFASGIEVTVETTDCAGNGGFSTFDSRALYKIQAADCNDPNTGKPLQQIVLQSRDATVRFDVLSVTEDEARSVMQQIRKISDARLERLTGPEITIESRSVISHQAEPASPPTAQRQPAPPAPGSQETRDLPGPMIDLLDPPLARTRAVTSVVTPDDAKSRAIVGRIDAPAGLLSLTVNGQPQSIDSRGLFKVDMPLKSTETAVELVAIDHQGKQDRLQFQLFSRPPLDTTGEPETGQKEDIFGNYHALIIANNHYARLDDLNTPANDADAIAGVLEQQYGFRVIRLKDASRYEILSALNGLRRELTDEDNLILYYAGHGEYDKTNHRGHWLPVDAEEDSTANWISTVAITDVINAMSAKHVLVIADSCYSGALTRGTNTDLDPNLSPDLRRRWLEAIARSRSRYVMTSGGVKPVLDDGGNGHSVFANALLKALAENQGILESSELFREVKNRVRTRAEELQIDTVPEYAQLKNTGHEYGEFLLVKRQ